jgi:hypothetical protein
MACRMSFGRKTKNSDEFFSCLRSDDFRQDKERQEQDCCTDERERERGDAGKPEAGRDRSFSDDLK